MEQMTPEQVLACLDQSKVWMVGGAEVDACCNVIKSVLEKQVPKKRKKRADDATFCGNCGSMLFMWCHGHYCGHCGQAIDWSE